MSRGRNDELLLVLAEVTVGQMAADRINDAASSACKCMDGCWRRSREIKSLTPITLADR